MFSFHRSQIEELWNLFSVTPSDPNPNFQQLHAFLASICLRVLANVTHPVTLTPSHYSADPQMVSLHGFSLLRSAGNIPHILPRPRIPDLPSPLVVFFHSGWHRVWSLHISYLLHWACSHMTVREQMNKLVRACPMGTGVALTGAFVNINHRELLGAEVWSPVSCKLSLQV